MDVSLFQDYLAPAADSGMAVLFGRRLQYLRKQARMRPDELAELIGISPYRLHQLEAGDVEADLVLLDETSQALGMTLSDLLYGL